MNEISVKGIITSVMPVGDYDRRVVILTKEIGRISAFAKFARRPNNRFLGSTREFICGEFKLYQGSSSYSISEIYVNNYFEEIYKDIEKTNYAMYFLDVINYYTRENNNERESLYLLYRTLQAIQKEVMPYKFIKAVFEFKMLVIQGEYPVLFRYQDTKEKIEKSDKYLFGIKENGLVRKNGFDISIATIKTMLYIISSGVKNIYNFRVDKKTEKEFISIVDKYFQSKVDYKFKSLSAIEWFEDISKIKDKWGDER